MIHGLWTKKELATIKAGKDNDLITEFLNETTFSKEEIAVYPYHLRKEYQCTWDIDCDETATIYATNDKALRMYIQRNYTHFPSSVIEIITTTREVSTLNW
jgi:hypothetical protein